MKVFTTKFTAFFLVIAVLFPVFSFTAYADTPIFHDIAGSWAKPYIERMAEAGVVNGFEDGSFKPDDPATLEQFTAILLRILHISPYNGKLYTYENSDFLIEADSLYTGVMKEVSTWSAPYLYTAYNERILSTTSVSSADKPLTRRESAVMIANAFGFYGVNSPVTETKYTDIGDYESNKIFGVIEAGIMAGYDDGLFHPEDIMTRAQLCTVSARLMDYYEEVMPKELFGKEITKLEGVCVGFYEDGQSPGTYISEEQIVEKLKLIKLFAKSIRTYGMSDGLDKVPELAYKMGFDVYAGVYIGKDDDKNREEIEKAAAVKNYCRFIIVGNEALTQNLCTVNQLEEYIAYAVSLTGDEYKISTAETSDGFMKYGFDASDLTRVFLNVYPFWGGSSPEDALTGTVRAVEQLTSFNGWNNTKVILAEFGSPTSGAKNGEWTPSKHTAAQYISQVLNYNRENQLSSYNMPIFPFEFNDEEWKTESGYGSHFGIFDSDGNLKPGMEIVFLQDADNKPDITLSTKSDKKEIVIESWENNGKRNRVTGYITGFDPDKYAAVIFIKVGQSWWIKPYFSEFTRLSPSGAFSAPTNTGGVDETATELCVMVLPYDGERYSAPSSYADAESRAVLTKTINRTEYP